MNYEVQSTNYELRIMNYELRSKKYELMIPLKPRVKTSGVEAICAANPFLPYNSLVNTPCSKPLVFMLIIGINKAYVMDK